MLKRLLPVLIFLAVFANIVSYAPSYAAIRSTEFIETPMTIAGKVAKIEEQKQGQLRLTLTTGKSLIVQDTPAIRQLPLSNTDILSPLSLLPGDCGSSYVYLTRLA